MPPHCPPVLVNKNFCPLAVDSTSLFTVSNPLMCLELVKAKIQLHYSHNRVHRTPFLVTGPSFLHTGPMIFERKPARTNFEMMSPAGFSFFKSPSFPLLFTDNPSLSLPFPASFSPPWSLTQILSFGFCIFNFHPCLASPLVLPEAVAGPSRLPEQLVLT